MSSNSIGKLLRIMVNLLGKLSSRRRYGLVLTFIACIVLKYYLLTLYMNGWWI